MSWISGVMKGKWWLFALIVLVSCSKDDDVTSIVDNDPIEEDDSDAKILRDKAAFGIGAAVTTEQLNQSLFANTVKTHFSQISAEYEMKMNHIWTSSSQYTWTKADAFVNYAKNNNLDVHGHTLLWYKSFPQWFTDARYDSIQFESRVRDYLKATVERYKGDVIAWDVVNEIFNDNGSLRMVDCPVYATFKDPIGFYGRCFKYVRELDPDTKLFYNDYNVVLASGKRYAIKQMVARFKSEGIPIDGLGDQFHYMVTTSQSVMRSGLSDMAATGLLIHISELDLRVNVNKSDSYEFNLAEQLKQSDAYQEIVESFEALPQAQKYAISTWGVTDKYTWLTDWWHPKEYPLLFDASFNKKHAYEGFLKGLK